MELTFCKWATHASLCSSAHGHVESHSHYGSHRRSGSYRVIVSSYMYAIILRWYVKASSLHDRDLSRNQSATIYFLCNESSFFYFFYFCFNLHLKLAADTSEDMRCRTRIVTHKLCIIIFLYTVHTKFSESDSHIQCWIYIYMYMRPCILYPASTPSRGTRMHYYVSSAEGLNGAADVQFSLCFWSAYNINRTCLLSL